MPGADFVVPVERCPLVRKALADYGIKMLTGEVPMNAADFEWIGSAIGRFVRLPSNVEGKNHAG